MFAARAARPARLAVRRYATGPGAPPPPAGGVGGAASGEKKPDNTPLLIAAGLAAAVGGYYFINKKDDKSDAEKLKSQAKDLTGTAQDVAAKKVGEISNQVQAAVKK
ncbi:uncharacterized protein EHS24_003037 [Apiotrichum porosum]|uniref:Uncharacterized protein n=1 Tax=Apiotrichum porosum TaxID=105984 RepID=A0A427XGS7_9TREE|nr:uncharacterized protein EHS24_003037 [Apiotrichum porosum]RSH77963.1 hypothetical protein EHS24_003037 [Apiotrichum porosum]